jgi:diguanylate cyclase (GGDEF)-like protein
MARVTANEDSSLLEMKWDSIKQLGRYHPRVAMRLYRNLATVLSRRVADFTEEKENSRDELTGALTKPFLCEIYQQEIKRSKHFSEPMSLMLLDIDIQPVDGEIDRDASDKIIVSITRTIKGLLQPTDILARWDECAFMVMLPRANSASALALAKTIEKAIESSVITAHARIDISATVTEVTENDDRKDAIDRLEKKLVESKKARKSLHVSLA